LINTKKFKSVGIVGFGGYIPYWRIKTSLVGNSWGCDGEAVSKSLGVVRKSVASKDEDSLTMAVEASLIALKRAGINPKKIGAVFVGSESHPYIVKPTGTILADILGIDNEYYCVDLQFACKAATSGVQIVSGMIESGMIDYGLVVGSDKAQAEPGDILEYTAAAGAAAFILGNKLSESYVQMISLSSFSSDTSDFWRRQGCNYPSHMGRFTGKPGYFYHTEKCLYSFLKKHKKKTNDFEHIVLHAPNAKYPAKVAKIAGFKASQIEKGFLVSEIGNPYAASSMLGLASVLENAKANENVLLVSYGSGAGSDVLWLKTRKAPKRRLKGKLIENYLSENKEISYSEYLRKQEVI
jgi:hydroxymethylglutaryl-CoA synthase